MSRVPVAPGTLDFRPWAQRVGLPWSGETPKALLGGNTGCRGSLNVSKDVIWSASEPCMHDIDSREFIRARGGGCT